MLLGPLELVCERNVESLEVGLEKSLNVVIGLLTHSNEPLENKTAEVNTDIRGLLLEVLEENKDSVRNHGHLYDSLAGSGFILPMS